MLTATMHSDACSREPPTLPTPSFFLEHQVTMQCEPTAVGVQRAHEYEGAVMVLIH